ncbi:MAG: hypothetical protein WC373_13875 [Smithella sp.]|jgi:hypothetical protein
MHIGEKTLLKGGEMLTNSMLTYEKAINQAFLKSESGELKISLSLSIKPGAANGAFKLQSGIKFVTDQINDTFTDQVDELQVNLFENKEEPTKMCPLRDGVEIFEYVCRECPDRLDLILVTGNEMPAILSEAPTSPPAENDMIQYRSCSAWADDDCHENIENMLLWEPEEKQEPAPGLPVNLYRIRNKKTNVWWEGEAVSAAAALELAGWKQEDCEIKVRSHTYSGGWKKCHEFEGKKAA